MPRIINIFTSFLASIKISWLALAMLSIVVGNPLFQPARAQSINPDSLSFLRIGVSQGLSQSFINCIHQDRYGFMWFGTQDGLNFYDGYSFIHYRHDPRDPRSLPSNIILCMVEDKKGHFYVGTTGGGLCYFDRKTFVPIPLPRSRPQDIYDTHISALYIDSSGLIWIGTRGRQLFRYDPTTKSVTTFSVPQNGKLSTPVYVRDIMEDSQNRLWVALDLGGVAIVDRTTGAFHRLTLPGEFRKRSRLLNVLSIAQDWYGNIILGTHCSEGVSVSRLSSHHAYQRTGF